MARVLMAASEAAPFVKTGGLADVLGGLPPALAKLGDDVAVVIPKYRKVELFGAERIYHDLPVWLGGTLFSAAIDRVVDRGVTYLFVNCPPLFDREGIYNIANQDYPDNHIRFAAFSRAAMEIVRRIYRPQVIHYHDWQASMIGPYLRETFASDPRLRAHGCC
jgi:starch synthase